MDKNDLSLIIGLGQTGTACARHLQRRQEPFVMFDTRQKPPALEKDIHTTLYTETLPESLWSTIQRVIVSPGVDPKISEVQQAIQLGIPVMGDIELFCQATTKPIIAITGTNAKSTTTSLVNEMINAGGKKALIGGNFGIAALDLLNEPAPDYYVLELSSFQLEMTSSLRAHIAALLNLSPNHLDRHGTMDHYTAAKLKIFQGAECGVIHQNLLQSLADKIIPKPPTMRVFSLANTKESGLYVDNGMIYYQHQPLLAQAELSSSLFGQHNLENVLGALTIIASLNLQIEGLIHALKNFVGLPYRCRFVKESRGVRWFNDSKGTTIGATIAAIKGIASHSSGRLLLILGGIGKGQDFETLAPTVAEYVHDVIIFGQDRNLIANELSSAQITGGLYLTETMEQAFQLTRLFAKPTDQVLFSPACASYDQFKDYLARGKAFDELLQKT